MANLEFSNAAWAAVSDGIFIPAGDLPGTTSTELASGVALEQKKAGFLFSFLKAIKTKLTATSYLTTQNDLNYLGTTLTYGEALPQTGRLNHTFTFSFQWVANKDAATFEMLPLATTGTFTDKGKLLLTDVCPGAIKVAAAANTSGAGVLIPSAELADFGIASHASIDLAADARMLLQAILGWLKDKELVLRTATVASAITALSRTTANLAIPAAAFDATNPLTGLGGSAGINQNLYIGATETMSFTVQSTTNDQEVQSPLVVTA